MKPFSLLVAFLSVLALSGVAEAESSPDGQLARIMSRWAEVQYEVPADERVDAFSTLAEEAGRLGTQFPGRAEPKIWEAIIRGSLAGAMGGIQSLFSALPEVTAARELLLEAEQIDPSALDFSVYTSLGSLYYQVPGFPIGFGDEDMAREYLEKALEASPDGIDANYFMGDYWAKQGEPKRARPYLQRALSAPPRVNRPLADRGRRQEAREAIANLEG